MKLKIGLLPLYVKLYDDFWPELRVRIDLFIKSIISEFEIRNMDVIPGEVCRIKSEFERAVKLFEKENVDAIVTLHIAYSPSLESVDALSATKLPLVILDTTPTIDYSPTQNPNELSYNHGIHGVQDMCNLLLRRGKGFQIEAGHWEQSDVLDRVAECVKAAKIAWSMRNARVGRVGKPFDGMGDFVVPEEVMLSTIGIKTIPFDFKKSLELLEEVPDEQINKEIERDKQDFHVDKLNSEVYRKSTQVCLAMRKWIEKNKLSAFTVNFMEINRHSGLACMPFMEAGKAMAGGIGYAGEGDVLTAALVGALLSVYPNTSFAEMFCPDWKNDTIFLSHMGEMNLSLTVEKPILKEVDFPYTDADNPVVAYGRFRSGKALYVNLAPGRGDTYSLIISPIEMIAVKGEDKMEDSIHGWFKAGVSVSEFLSAYSKNGGTHHGAVVYGAETKVLEGFAEIMGWKLIKIPLNC